MHIHICVIQFSACDVTWYNVFWFCAGGTGGGGLVHPKGANSMAASGISCRKALVSTGWAISLLLCKNGVENSLLAM